MEVLEQGKSRWLVNGADDAFAPAVRSGIVHRTDSGIPLRRQKLLVDQRQVLAQRKAPLEPARRVAERDALIRADEPQLTDHPRPRRVERRFKA